MPVTQTLFFAAIAEVASGCSQGPFHRFLILAPTGHLHWLKKFTIQSITHKPPILIILPMTFCWRSDFQGNWDTSCCTLLLAGASVRAETCLQVGIVWDCGTTKGRVEEGTWGIQFLPLVVVASNGKEFNCVSCNTGLLVFMLIPLLHGWEWGDMSLLGEATLASESGGERGGVGRHWRSSTKSARSTGIPRGNRFTMWDARLYIQDLSLLLLPYLRPQEDQETGCPSIFLLRNRADLKGHHQQPPRPKNERNNHSYLLRGEPSNSRSLEKTVLSFKHFTNL